MSEITNAEFSYRCDILKVLKSQVSSPKKLVSSYKYSRFW